VEIPRRKVKRRERVQKRKKGLIRGRGKVGIKLYQHRVGSALPKIEIKKK